MKSEPSALSKTDHFFQTLYAHCHGQINVRVIDKDKPTLSENLRVDKFATVHVLERHRERSIYFGVATRNGGGKKEDIVHIPALWVDIDFKDTPEEEAVPLLQGFSLKPSALVNSGGGYHCYWNLKEPLEKNDIAAVECMLKRLAVHFKGDMAATDASRILRVPGSINQKYDPPRSVTIFSLQEGNRYTLDDFDDILPALVQPVVQEGTTAIYTHSEQADRLMECAFMKHCADNAADLSEPLWFAMVSNAARVSPGGPDLCHKFSRNYPKYSRQETDAKILHTLNGSAPITCAKIREHGFDCKRTCGVRSPVGLAGRRTEPTTAEAVETAKAGPSSEEILDALKNNEDGDTALFIGLHQGQFIYDHAAGRWFHWKGNWWGEDTFNDVIAATSSVVKLYEAEYNRQASLALSAAKRLEKDQQENHNKVAVELLKRIKLLQTAYRKENVIKLARTGSKSLSTSGMEWDQDPWLLAVRNGIIDLREGKARPGKHEDFIKTAAPVEWRGLNEPCPAWEHFLETTFDGTDEIVQYLKLRCGYSLVGLTTEHDFVILEGPGRNGKTTFVEALRNVLGEYSGQIETESLLHQLRPRQGGSPTSDIMSLRGKRMVYATEADQGRCINAGKLKWITGGDTLTGREVYGKRQVSFSPTFKIWFLTNHLPHIDADDYAVWKRVRRIPFRYSFVQDPTEPHERQADTFLLEKLKAEGPGILAWMVRGCIEWQAEGLMPPDIVRDATKSYQGDEDLIGKFIDDRCVLDRDNQVAAGDLYAVYRNWCADNGHKPTSGTRFGKNIAKRFRKARSYENNIVYHGLILR